MARKVAYTIGYEGRSLDEFVALLQSAGVERVVDVRALPLSRRRGFSKTALREHLAEHGIGYVHVRAAGNPYREFKKDPERCLALYSKHLEREPVVLEQVAEALEGRCCALLCFEARHEHCHRSVIAARLAQPGFGRTMKHL
jgi:uncharacterized protein (DUF488 family)